MSDTVLRTLALRSGRMFSWSCGFNSNAFQIRPIEADNPDRSAIFERDQCVDQLIGTNLRCVFLLGRAEMGHPGVHRILGACAGSSRNSSQRTLYGCNRWRIPSRVLRRSCHRGTSSHMATTRHARGRLNRPPQRKTDRPHRHPNRALGRSMRTPGLPRNGASADRTPGVNWCFP